MRRRERKAEALGTVRRSDQGLGEPAPDGALEREHIAAGSEADRREAIEEVGLEGLLIRQERYADTWRALQQQAIEGDIEIITVTEMKDAEIGQAQRAAASMEQGIEWGWSTFAEHLAVLDRLPMGINYAANIGHSALRTWVMGERAFDGPATDDDLAAMERELRRALAAGAVGFTTSRADSHTTSDDRPVASRLADWREVCHLVGAMGDAGREGARVKGEDSVVATARHHAFRRERQALAPAPQSLVLSR